MNIEKNKAARIMKEIVSYFLDEHLNDFTMHFDVNDERFELHITAPCLQEPRSFQRLLTDLQTPRQIEIDEYFNALLGGHCHSHDYSFLGKAIDEAEGEYSDGYLKLVIRRYKMK